MVVNAFPQFAPELTPEEEKRQASLHRHRVKSRERYQKIKAGEHAVGQPFKLTLAVSCSKLSRAASASVTDCRSAVCSCSYPVRRVSKRSSGLVRLLHLHVDPAEARDGLQ